MKYRIMTMAAVIAAASILPVYALSEEELIEAAKEYIPAEAEFIEMEKDGKFWEAEFILDQQEYEVILTGKGKVKEVEFDAHPETGGKSFALETDEIRRLIRKQYGNAEKIRIRKKQSRKKGCTYEVKFRSDEIRGEVKFNAETGEIIEYELRYSRSAAALP